jgi:putative membrane protein
MMSVIGALIALRHWLRLSARARLKTERERAVKAAPGGTKVKASATAS